MSGRDAERRGTRHCGPREERGEGERERERERERESQRERESERVREKERLVFDTDDGVGTIVTFVNIYDRGYWTKLAAWLAGKQQTLQPPSAKSVERFRYRTTVYAAAIARDCSGNERAVNVCKRPRMMKRGFRPGMNPIRFNYVWREWAFRANFMYKPIL